MASNRSLAFDAARMREHLLAQVTIPADMVSDALAKTKAKLSAKETKFFTHRGEVVSQVDVEAHEVQLRAADQIYSIAGIYARERDAPPPQPTVAIEIVDGVVRLVIGAPSTGEEAMPLAVSVDEREAQNHSGDPSIRVALAAGVTPETMPPIGNELEEPPPQVIRVPRNTGLSPELKALLFGVKD